MEKLQITNTLLVKPHVSNASVSNKRESSTMPVIIQLQYTCAMCLQHISTRDLLISHVFSHYPCINSPLHICEYCGLVSSNLCALSFQENKKVVFKEPSLIEFACALCTDIFLSWCSLTKHVFTHISSVSFPLYVCTYCSKVFKDMTKLQLHKYTGRSSQRRGCDCKNANEQLSAADFQTGRIEEELITTCNHSKFFTNRQSYVGSKSEEMSTICEQHETKCIWSCSVKNTQKVYAPFSDEVSNKSNTITGDLKKNPFTHPSECPLICDICGKMFTLSGHLNNHHIHLDKRPLSCDDCRTLATEHGRLKIMQRINSNERSFSCEFCGKSFTRSKNLKAHQHIHFDKRQFYCDVCGKTYASSKYLKHHQRIHLSERPFSCDICGKSFNFSASLKYHKRNHLDQRPFPCDVCGKSFSQSCGLKLHQRIHSGERPFICHICGKSFTHSGSLKNHQRIHSGERPFSCEICEKSFTESGQLKTHQRIHSSERPFTCDICKKSFRRSADLKIHYRIHLKK